VPPWAHAGVREAALLVSNHSMRAGDRGVVIAGGSAQAGDLAGHSAPGTHLAGLCRKYLANHPLVSTLKWQEI